MAPDADITRSARVVRYAGPECIGGFDVAPGEIGAQIRDWVREGFRVEWSLKKCRIYVGVFESWDEPLEWEKVFAEESFVNIEAILREAGFDPPPPRGTHG